MKNILNLLFISSLFVITLILPSCSDDEIPVTNTETEPPSETYNGVFILCQGADVYPQERYIGFYDLDKDEYIYNIFKPGLLPRYPRSMVYSKGNLYVTTSSFYYNVPSSIVKISAWGNNRGNLEIEQFKQFNPNLLFNFNNKFSLTYFITSGINYGTFETFNDEPLGNVVNFPNIKGFVSSCYFLGDKVYLTTTYQQGNIRDSSLIMFTPPDTASLRTLLSGEPNGITLINGNRILVGCSGVNSMLYFINSVNLQIIDSVTSLNGFAKDLVTDQNKIYSYFISQDDKIVKFNPVQKAFYTFITNSFASENYFISGYNIDPNTGKHYVLISNRGDYYGGKMQIYSSNGFLEKTIAVGKKPIQVVFANEN